MADAYSKLHLDFTDDGTLKVITEGTLSLQKQVRALRQELTLPIYSEAQRTQIRLALQEAEIGLANTKVQSRELFAQLSLIPGPIGLISTQIQGVVMGFRALSALSLKDLITQFKNLGLSLFGGTANISNAINIAEEITKGKSGGGGPKVVSGDPGLKEVTQDTALFSAALSTAGVALQNNILLQNQFGKVISEVAVKNLNGSGKVISAWSNEVYNASGKLQGYTVNVRTLNNATVELTKEGAYQASQVATLSKVTDALKTSTMGLTTAENVNTAAIIANTTAKNANTVATVENEVVETKFTQKVNAGYLTYLNTLVRVKDAGVSFGTSIAKYIIVPLSELALKFTNLISPITSVIVQFGRFISMGIASVIGAIGSAIGALGVSAAALATAVQLLGATLLSVFTLGIGTAVVAGIIFIKTNIDKITFALFGYRMETDKTKASVESFTQSLKAQKEALDLEIQGIEYGTKMLENKAKLTNATEAQIIEIQKKAGKEKLAALITNDDILFAKQKELRDKEGKYAKLSNDQKLKLNEEVNASIVENGRAINKQIMDNALIVSNFEVTKSQEKYRRKLAELDALIELEIRKNDTDKKVLEGYLQDRLDLVNEHEHLSAKERELIRAQNEEKVTAALVDDTTRTIDAEIIKNKKIIEESKNGSKELFESRKNIAKLEYDKELEEAKKNKLTEEAAKKAALIKYNGEIKKITEDEVKYGVDLLTKQLESEIGKSSDYFNKERELENARNKQKLDDKKLSDKEIEAENARHQKKLTEINVEENKQQLKLQQMFTEGSKTLQQMTGAWWTDFDKQFFDERRVNAVLQYDENIKLTKEGSDERKALEFQLGQDLLQIDRDEMNARKVVQYQQVEWALQITDILVSLGNTFFKNNKDIQHALVAIQGAAQIAKIIAATEAGLAAATAEAAAVALIPVVGELAAAKLVAVQTATRISSGIAIAGVVAAQAAAWAQIDSGGAGGGGASGGGADRINRGKNYAAGGYIDGPSHANGGVPATLEGGEAVMTRGAVTAFAPLLSLMNQAGGGTAFSQAAMGQAKFDNPRITNNAVEPQIIKTYIVENELTSIQQRQARLKSLSTL